MNSVNREKLLLIAAAVAVVVLFGDKFVLGPLLMSWDDRSIRIEELEKKSSSRPGAHGA